MEEEEFGEECCCSCRGDGGEMSVSRWRVATGSPFSSRSRRESLLHVRLGTSVRSPERRRCHCSPLSGK